MAFEVRFWGVRGSVASPGPDTAAVGGNTSSLEVRAGDTRVLLDAGTGIRQLGDALLAEGRVDVTILLSHLHWDHIQGLPFFTPVYLPTTRVRIWGPPGERTSLHDVLAQQMAPPVFPVTFDDLASRIETRELHAGERFRLGSLDVSVARLNHPGGVLAYRLESGGHALVYATDNEPGDPVFDKNVRRLAEGADVLIYDSQYLPEEYEAKRRGWGHSHWREAVNIVMQSGSRELVLFHHDPDHDDTVIDKVVQEARNYFPRVRAAAEGMEMVIGTSASSVAGR